MGNGRTTILPGTEEHMPAAPAGKEPTNTVITPLKRSIPATAVPSIRLSLPVRSAPTAPAPVPTKVTIFPMVPGQTTAAANTAGLFPVLTAATEAMNMPAILCPTEAGLPQAPPSTDGRYPVPAATAPQKPKVTV